MCLWWLNLFLGLQFLNADVQLLHLATHLAYSRFDARAPSTVSKHALLWRQFTAWMAARVPPVRALNTPSELVALYLTRLRLESAALSLGPSRVLEASAAIACHHALFGCVSPTNHPPILVVGFLWPTGQVGRPVLSSFLVVIPPQQGSISTPSCDCGHGLWPPPLISPSCAH
jgi:hypothetical protein